MESTKIFDNIVKALEFELKEMSSNVGKKIINRTIAAELHEYYNQVGINEGWLKKEYATKLAKQDKTNQLKNVRAAEDVILFWLRRLRAIANQKSNSRAVMRIINAMKKSVLYEVNRSHELLNEAAHSQHEQWIRFVGKHQADRVTFGHKNFRENNYKQYIKSYIGLSKKEKDQDRLIVAVVTDRVLARANIGYTHKILL
jgi:hypothetical protein